MVGHGEKLSRKQEAAIAALLSCKTIAEAAKAAGIGENTLFRWLRLDDFQNAYRKARKDVVSQAIGQIQNGLSDAVKTLQSVMNNKKAPASARVSAARSMIDLGLKGVEIEDLQSRVEALERAITNIGAEGA